jgi:Calcineurin-like phosphoesterase
MAGTGEPDYPTVGSSRTSQSAAGWNCAEIGTFRQLVPKGRAPFSWVSPVPLIQSRNDVIARRLGDPTNEERRRWVASQMSSGEHPDFMVMRRGHESRVSFLLLGDPGEGDASQYAVVPAILHGHRDTDFMFICSDVVYPAGDVNEYEHKFYRPYRDYPGPIYAIPGNHDWYDGLTGFMHHFCHNDGLDRPAPSSAPEPRWKSIIRRLLWRNPRKPDARRLESMKALRDKPEQQAHQPGPYFALDAGPLLLVGIDTGIRGILDVDQGEWLRRMSRIPKPKVLLTGAPIYADGTYVPGR